MQETKKMEWKRITDPILIPRVLVEQIEPRDFDVKDFYNTLAASTGYATRQFREDCYLYILLEEPGAIAGFFWAEYDLLTRCLYSHYTSILKKYWHTGVGPEMLKAKLVEIMKQRKLTVCRLLSDKPKAMESLGFSPAKRTLHEFKLAVEDA